MRWFRWGVFGIVPGILGWILLFLFDHMGGRAREVTSRIWAFTGEPIGGALNRIVMFIGNHFGVRYGYIPYYPLKGVETFLRILSFLLPVLACFLGGIIARVFFLTTRSLRSDSD